MGIPLTHYLKRLDVGSLAGRRSVLAITFAARSLRLLELKNSAHAFNRFAPSFQVVRTLRMELAVDIDSNVKAKTNFLRRVIAENQIRTKQAVTILPPHAVKTIVVTIPEEVESIESWMEEHYDSLLEYPPPRSKVRLHYEILSQADSGALVEISCVRIEEVRSAETICADAGLEVVWIGTTERAFTSALEITTSILQDHPEVEMVWATPRGLLRTFYRNARKERTEVVDCEDPTTQLERITNTRTMSDPSTEKLLLYCGDEGGGSEQTFSGAGRFRPLGVDSEYAALVGLAAGAFVPELAGANLLPPEVVARVEMKLYSELAQRVVLVLGGILIIVLGIIATITRSLEESLSSVDESLRSAGVTTSELSRLEGDVEDLRGKLTSIEQRRMTTTTSKVLHDLARLTPDSVYWSTLTWMGGSDRSSPIALTGYAHDPSRLARFLRAIEASGQFPNVNFIRSSSAAVATTVSMPSSLRRTPWIAFEITLEQGGGEP